MPCAQGRAGSDRRAQARGSAVPGLRRGAWKDAHFEGYKPSTRKGVRSVLDRQLVPAFGSKPLDRITPAHIGRWFDRFSRTAGEHIEDLLALGFTQRPGGRWTGLPVPGS